MVYSWIQEEEDPSDAYSLNCEDDIASMHMMQTNMASEYQQYVDQSNQYSNKEDRFDNVKTEHNPKSLIV
ncbi:MAG: hypothetical protein NPIRA04_13600 [Nitrospirales bacterium]|nr:MAG: hypothetical protein NPIRA04_13600 [Nitrospirales bacterium]